MFWRFVEYPDKERVEVTKERDVAVVYNGDKGYEVTYKGAHPLEKKDLDDYLRRRKFSLETMLRTWVNDPRVALFYDGNALAGNLPAQQVTLINSKDEAVTSFPRSRHPSAHQEELLPGAIRWISSVISKKKSTTITGPVQGVMTP